LEGSEEVNKLACNRVRQLHADKFIAENELKKAKAQLADARKALENSEEATKTACRRVHQLDSVVIELSEREKIKTNMFEQLRRQLTDTQKANNILIQKLKDAHSQIEAQTQVLAKDVMERAIRSDDFSLTFTVIVEKKA